MRNPAIRIAVLALLLGGVLGIAIAQAVENPGASKIAAAVASVAAPEGQRPTAATGTPSAAGKTLREPESNASETPLLAYSSSPSGWFVTPRELPRPAVEVSRSSGFEPGWGSGLLATLALGVFFFLRRVS